MLETKLQRRAVLRGGLLFGAGLAGAALLGCDDDDDDDDDGGAAQPTAAGATGTPASTATEAATATPTETGPGLLNADLLQRNNPESPYAYVLPEPDTTPKPGGTFRFAWNNDIAKLDPTTSTSGATLTIPNTTGNRLVRIRSNGVSDPFRLDLDPDLATSWEVSADGLAIVFNLTDKAKYHNIPPVNGRAFTAADAKFVFERYQSEGISRGTYSNVDHFEAPDDTTFSIVLNRPAPDLLAELGFRSAILYAPEMVEENLFEEPSVSIGTGAFIATRIEPGSGATFVKNPDYFRREVLLDGAEFRVMRDAAAKIAAFRAGQVEYGGNLIGTKREADTLADSVDGVQINLHPPLRAGFGVVMNLTNPKFQDERVRRALSLAIDRNGMNAAVYDGLGAIADFLPWQVTFDNQPTVESGEFGDWMRYDPDEAKKLLDGAGVTDLSFEMIWRNFSVSENQSSNEILVDMLRDIGVQVNLNEIEPTSYTSQYTQAEYSEAADGYASGLPLGTQYYHNHVRGGLPSNWMNLDDPQINEWADAQVVETDDDARRELLRNIWDRMLDQMYRIPKLNASRLEAYQPYVRNFRIGVLGGATNGGGGGDPGYYLDEAWFDQ